jgi:hypothetical protein
VIFHHNLDTPNCGTRQTSVAHLLPVGVLLPCSTPSPAEPLPMPAWFLPGHLRGRRRERACPDTAALVHGAGPTRRCNGPAPLCGAGLPSDGDFPGSAPSLARVALPFPSTGGRPCSSAQRADGPSTGARRHPPVDGPTRRCGPAPARGLPGVVAFSATRVVL